MLRWLEVLLSLVLGLGLGLLGLGLGLLGLGLGFLGLGLGLGLYQLGFLLQLSPEGHHIDPPEMKFEYLKFFGFLIRAAN